MAAAVRPEPAQPFDPFAWALAWVLKWEGGYADHPADHGGATNQGITQATYADWQRSQHMTPVKHVRDITPDEVGWIYRDRYWAPVNGGGIASINAKMALCVFDAAVQSGIGVAARTLQRTVHAEPDGVVGKVTLSCYRLRRMKVGDRPLLENFMDRRRGFYAAIVLRDRTQVVFAKGWRNRRNDLRATIGLDPEED